MRRFIVSTLLALALPLTTHAATFIVTNTADSGAGSLRQALINAGTDTTFPRVIQFGASFPQGGVIELQTTLPTWSNDILKIEGNGRMPVLDGRNAVRILVVAAGTREITLRGLTFRNGRSTAGVGGCVWHSAPAANTSLFVHDSHFQNCKAVGNQNNAYGGAIAWVSPGSWIFIYDSVFTGNAIGVIGNSSLKEAFGGAILLSGSRLEIVRTHFSGNTTERVGGHVQNLGGAVYAAATSSVLMTDSEFDSNRVVDADADGVISAGGAATLLCQQDDCQLSAVNVGFIDNTVSGVDTGGGALVTAGGQLSLINAGFSGNRASGGWGGALLALPGKLSARHLSFQNNEAAAGAHLALSGVEVTQWQWSLIGPAAAGSGTSCELSSTSLTGPTSANLFESACDVLSVSGAIVGPVGPLTLDDSVFPATLAPGAGSPAIDPDYPQDACFTTSDARGMPRPQDGNGDGIARCDVGAYEVQGPQVFADGFE